ncbi:MAG: DUF4012 domain-containing protein [Patescibacteria group bacterium]|nr:DUF4012 domain-containing protein [Patescibacteria group bacterium]
MKELKFLKIIILICISLSIIGGVVFSYQRLTSENFSLIDILDSKQISFLKMIPEIAGFNGERTYLLLFQNNLELRPSGGYLGNFGIIKVKNGNTTVFETHDTNIFDGFGKIQTESPKPIQDYLGINNWQMRDGNWSPDFKISAEQVEYFYHLQGGQENFDGVIAVNAGILPNLLKLTGPVYLQEFDKEFKSEDVLYQLEYEVEKAYVERNIEEGERKKIFKALINEILERAIQGNLSFKNELKNLALKELDEKNIILSLKDIDTQKTISKFKWDGKVDQLYKNDYLMIVEANLASKKSNAFIEREVEYAVNLNEEKPRVNLKIKYAHQNKEKDWFNDDYRFYLRIYTPIGSWLENSNGMSSEIEFTNELNKTVFGSWVEVPAGQEKIIEFEYTLPTSFNQEEYKILVQKQSGIDSFPFKLILEKDKEYIMEEIIVKDWEGAISLEK